MLQNGLDYNSLVGFEDIQNYAEQHNVSNALSAIKQNSPLIQKVSLWPDIKELKEEEKIEPVLVSDKREDLLAKVSVDIAKSVQFPFSTAYLHTLGCVASAMTRSFSIEFGWDEIPCNLYVLTAQPPSTGKSSINNRLFKPVREAYKQLNESTEQERKMLISEVNGLRKEVDTNKDQQYAMELWDKLQAKEKRLEQIPEWKPALTDVTIEAAEDCASNQDGMFNIVSAEAESVNVIFGAVYGDGNTKKNQGLLLSAWDGEYVSIGRITRKGYTGNVRATVSVIAQDDSIDTVLAAGASGRGLTERFLILSERSNLGYRKYGKKHKKHKCDPSIYRQYESLIENIVTQKDTALKIDEESEELIDAYVSNIEEELREEGEFSHSLLTGFMGKATKHILKLASVLHVSKNWQDGQSKSPIITGESTVSAIILFKELAKTFINASDHLGYVGTKSELLKLTEVFEKMANTKKLKINISQLRNQIKNVKPFKGSRNLTSHLKNKLLPKLEDANICVVDDQTIYINPRLK